MTQLVPFSTNIVGQARFFTFDQNNSGGYFTGPAIDVVVEARTADEANARAEDLGLYFDGAGDCIECCGYRWSEQYDDDDGTEVPSKYGEPITAEGLLESFSRRWVSSDKVPLLAVYTLDGAIYYFGTPPGWKADTTLQLGPAPETL